MIFRLAFTLVPFAFAGLLWPVFVRKCAKSRKARAAWMAAILACAAKFAGFKVFGGDAFAPDMPEFAIWAWDCAYSAMCILLALSIAFFWLKARLKTLLLPLLAAAVAAWGVWNGIKPPEVRTVEIVCRNLPKELDGYKIVQITDLHASSAARRWRTEATVSLANSLGADLAVVTGDIVDGKAEDRAPDVEPLRGLKARDGVLFCTGNHEYYMDRAGWKKLYSQWGFKFLENAWTSPRKGIVVGGVPDPAAFITGEEAPYAADAFAAAPDGAFRILLQHRPVVKTADGVEQPKCDLQLSGHTHGGIAPGIDAVVALANGGMVRGLYDRAGGGKTYVSAGSGQWAGFPTRFFNDPELTLITLRAADGR